MNTHANHTQSRNEDRPAESAGRRIRVRPRADAPRQVSGVGGARILRRWSVSELIARAAGAPRAFA
jgi:hypothetical protein